MEDSILLLVIIILLFMSMWTLFLCIAAGSIIYQWAKDKHEPRKTSLTPGVYKQVVNALGQESLVPVQEESDLNVSDDDIERWMMGLNRDGSLAGRELGQ